MQRNKTGNGRRVPLGHFRQGSQGRLLREGDI